MRTQRPGHTLLELTIALLLTALLCGMAAPLVRSALDRHAVLAARDALGGALALTRATALAHGGAALELDAARGTIRIRDASGEPHGDLDIGRRHGVAIAVTGGETVIRYDALGIGRLANRSVRVRRGRAEAGLTISAYGRWRSW